MKTPAYWGISGFPISHSLTPRLFEIVGNALEIDEVRPVFLEANNSEEFKRNIEELNGDLWISITSPLKHIIGELLGISDEGEINSINQLMRSNGVWNGINTDGYGFVEAAKYIGINPSKSILKIRGGGSTARSIVAAWSESGGEIIPVNGRRKLVSGPWDISIIENGEADISVDLDVNPAGEESQTIKEKMDVSISYNEYSKIDDFAVIMLASQHLEAWKRFFLYENIEKLPNLSYILEKLFD
ncbi:MAG: hypothetical protein HON69_03935 [Euryarchaeota archaeon]|nr:hypothetical protein [Euryarchaeota archaeon]